MFTQVAELFHDLDAGMLPVSVLFPYLPIPPHRRRDRWAQFQAVSYSLYEPQLKHVWVGCASSCGGGLACRHGGVCAANGARGQRHG